MKRWGWFELGKVNAEAINAKSRYEKSLGWTKSRLCRKGGSTNIQAIGKS